MTLLIHWLALIVRRVRVRRVHLTIALLIHLIWSTRILARDLTTSRSVADGWKLRTNTGRVVGTSGCLRWVGSRAIHRLTASDGRTVSFLFGLASILFFLLAGLPFFANLLELCWASRLLAKWTCEQEDHQARARL